MSQKRSKQCYVCGKWANSYIRDHVPPKSLAGNVPGIQFTTLPACRDCNVKYSSEESRLRDFLAVIGSNLGIAEAATLEERQGMLMHSSPVTTQIYDTQLERGTNKYQEQICDLLGL